MSGEMNCGCDFVLEGEKAMDIAMKSHAHVMATTDEAHKPMREQMTIKTKHSEEEQKKWWTWFNAKWDKKKTGINGMHKQNYKN